MCVCLKERERESVCVCVCVCVRAVQTVNTRVQGIKLNNSVKNKSFITFHAVSAALD